MFIVNLFVIRDILIATCSCCVRSVSDDKAPETWSFLRNLSQRESVRVVIGGGQGESLHPLQMGTGHAAIAPKIQVFGLAWLVGRAACGQQRQPIYVLPGAASLNKLFVNKVCVLPCDVTKCSCGQSSSYPAHT